MVDYFSVERVHAIILAHLFPTFLPHAVFSSCDCMFPRLSDSRCILNNMGHGMKH